MSKFLPTVSDLFSQVHKVEENWRVNPILKFRVADRPREILKDIQNQATNFGPADSYP